MTKELATAQKAGLSMSPKIMPTIPGLQIAATICPARKVSGDYFDFTTTASGKHGFVIADVMGKGLSAAMVVPVTRSIMRLVAKHADSPKAVLSHVNNILLDDLGDLHTFVTVFYGVYDPDSKILSFSNAGHTPPLLWHNREKRVKPMHVPGVLAGVKPNAQFEEKTLKLAPGDVIILYTDGVKDVRNDEGKMIGITFLEDTLAEYHDFDAASISEVILHKISEYIKGDFEHLKDDITLVVIKSVAKNDHIRLQETESSPRRAGQA
ncbi:MAG: PP2C family protein-serine/threonine phosphatase [Syntrophothermus sp.]